MPIVKLDPNGTRSAGIKDQVTDFSERHRFLAGRKSWRSALQLSVFSPISRRSCKDQRSPIRRPATEKSLESLDDEYQLVLAGNWMPGASENREESELRSSQLLRYARGSGVRVKKPLLGLTIHSISTSQPSQVSLIAATGGNSRGNLSLPRLLGNTMWLCLRTCRSRSGGNFTLCMVGCPKRQKHESGRRKSRAWTWLFLSRKIKSFHWKLEPGKWKYESHSHSKLLTPSWY